jgi:ABC-type multidrug transport system ATPase subunit
MAESKQGQAMPSVASKLSIKQKVQVSWENLTYDVNTKKGPKRILQGVSGYASPGQVLAIMGSSGAGKTTLLNCLSGRRISGMLGGTIKTNGSVLTSRNSFRKVAAFVTQDDLMLETQTPREVVTFSACLRLGGAIDRATRNKIIDDVIRMLHLEKAADTLVGDPQQGGISGGERKRVNIAAEMVTNPTIVYVDEPTSGLDSYTALKVMDALRSIAVGGRTVVSTIHQPASEIYESFDNLMLLHQGHVAYFGRRANAVDYFAGLGVTCPPYYNPADFLLTTLMKQLYHESEAALPDFNQSFRGSALCEASLTPEKIDGCDKLISFKVEMGAGILLQLRTLFWRIWTNWKRAKLGLRVRMGQTLFFGVLIGLVYYDIPQYDHTYAGIQNRIGCLFFAMLNQMFGSLLGVVLLFPVERKIFEREHDGGFYRVWTYYLTRVLFDVPAHLVVPFIFSAIFYHLASLRATAQAFWTFTGTIILISQCAAGLGLMVGCLVPSPEVATTVAPVFLIPLIIVAGLLVNVESLQGFVWLEAISPIFCARHPAPIPAAHLLPPTLDP